MLGYSAWMALVSLLPVFATGCLSPLAKPASTVASATAPVVDQAAAAYRSANAIHNLRENYDAVVAFDAPAPAPVYNPRTIRPLMTEKDIQARVTVLAAFQEYVKTVVAVSKGTDSPELQAAAKSAGESLGSFGNALAPSIESALGVASAAGATTETTVTTISGNQTKTTSTTATTPAAPISDSVQNGISTAVDALGQFLVSRKVKKELPPIVVAMDPHVKVLCELLESDITTLRSVESRDYNFIINQQTQFVMSTKNLDPGQRRELIMNLPEIVRREQMSSEALQQLSDSIVRLESTHHALAVEAQANNPESLKQRLSELEDAGNELGNFYTSQPTK